MYIATVTQKGQVTIPKDIRDKHGISRNSRVVIESIGKNISIKKAKTILDFAGIFSAPKGMDALKAREYMQGHYKRA